MKLEKMSTAALKIDYQHLQQAIQEEKEIFNSLSSAVAVEGDFEQQLHQIKKRISRDEDLLVKISSILTERESN